MSVNLTKKETGKTYPPLFFSAQNFKNEEKIAIIFENAPIGMAMAEINGRFIKVNEAFRKMTGYSDKELLNKTFYDITHPDDLQTNKTFKRNILEGKVKSYEFEKRYITKQGNVIWVMLKTTLVKDINREPLCYVGHIQDITERKKIENQRESILAVQKNIADTLQKALIDVPHKIQGIDFGYLYKPATKSAKVGGDFYDLFKLHNNNVGAIIGDVSGKGLKAASLTALVKNTIKAYAYQGNNPGLIMTKTNNIVAEATSLGTFVTVFMAILNTKNGQLIYCSAGHPQAIVKNGNGTRMLKTSSGAIGVIPNERFINNSTSLATEDLLILYTDGVIEARCDSNGKRNGFYGEKRLLNTINKSKAHPKAICGDIFNSIMNCSGCTLPDDIAILSIALS